MDHVNNIYIVAKCMFYCIEMIQTLVFETFKIYEIISYYMKRYVIVAT